MEELNLNKIVESEVSSEIFEKPKKDDYDNKLRLNPEGTKDLVLKTCPELSEIPIDIQSIITNIENELNRLYRKESVSISKVLNKTYSQIEKISGGIMRMLELKNALDKIETDGIFTLSDIKIQTNDCIKIEVNINNGLTMLFYTFPEWDKILAQIEITGDLFAENLGFKYQHELENLDGWDSLKNFEPLHEFFNKIKETINIVGFKKTGGGGHSESEIGTGSLGMPIMIYKLSKNWHDSFTSEISIL